MTGEPAHPDDADAVQCPVRRTEIVPCAAEELAPLVAHLASGRSPADLPNAGRFPRGTLTADGRLDLCKQSLGTAHAVRVAEALRGNAHVRSLMLGTDAIGDAGAAAVGALAADSATLEALYLGCNNIGPEGARTLGAALAEAPGVTGLWLKRNPIGPAGARHLAGLLRRNQRLHVLDLVNTGLGDAGVQALADALCDGNHGLRELYLSGNGLGPSAAPALARLLRGAPHLEGLYLGVNRLGDDGVRVLAEALPDNRTLRRLELPSNGIFSGLRSLRPLLVAVATHPTLEALNLGYAASTRVLGAAPNDLRSVLGHAAIALRGAPALRRLDVLRTGLAQVDRSQVWAAAQESRTLTDLRIEGPWPAELDAHLAANRARLGVAPVPREIALIRSVYR